MQTKEYFKNYNLKNKQKRNAYSSNHYKLNKERKLLICKKYRDTHQEQIAKKAKIYRFKNRERISKKSMEWAKNNKEKVKGYLKKWRDNNKEKIKKSRRNTNLKHLYKMTTNDYEILYRKQKGLCAICLLYKEKLSIDHCHKTGKIRGLLCEKCNKGIGLLNDDIKILNNAIIYLFS